MEVFYFLFIGLSLGSFANVLIVRIPIGESVMGRSHCPNCHEKIIFRDLIPVISWVALKRKCRNCNSRISEMYPIVECITAILVIATIFLLPLGPYLIAWILFAPLSVALSAIDLQTFRLPNSLVLAATISTLIFIVLNSVFIGSWNEFKTAIIAAFSSSFFFWIVRLLSRGGMGLGDVKLAFPIGLLLGYLGWEHAVLGLFVAFLLGAIVGIALIVFRGASRKTPLPFGPFMLAGSWLALLLYEKLPMQLMFLTYQEVVYTKVLNHILFG